MSFPSHVWAQVKNKTADDIIRALEKDGWRLDMGAGSERIYYHPNGRRRVSIHYHPQKTYGPKLLKAVLDSIGWSEKRMRELKFIK